MAIRVSAPTSANSQAADGSATGFGTSTGYKHSQLRAGDAEHVAFVRAAGCAQDGESGERREQCATRNCRCVFRRLRSDREGCVARFKVCLLRSEGRPGAG